MDQDNSHNDVIIFKDGALGRITLNRPKALNALNLEMIRQITFALNSWESDDDVKAIFIDGAGDRAFCAGGDIKSFYSIGMDYRRGKIGFDVAMLFFDEEYDLNDKIFHYSKPVISFMHGITMGGGFGIAGHTQFKIIADDSIFAMPETKIGFFPDIGSMYHLTRMPQNTGLFLALTGASIDADDMYFCGLGDYSVAVNEKPKIIEVLNDDLAKKDGADVSKYIGETLEPYRYKKIGAGKIEKFSDQIDNVCSKTSLYDVVNGIMNELNYDDFSNICDICSPLSIAIAFKYYELSKNKSFSDIIKMDKALCANFIIRSEFYEGIRAALIDKDKAPNWEYKTVGSVPEDLVFSYFN